MQTVQLTFAQDAADDAHGAPTERAMADTESTADTTERAATARAGGAQSGSPWSDPLLWAAVTGVVFIGAIFGFFFAWVCSTMWGLDNIDPRVAITAMNGMNDSVRNFVFAPAFFGTAPVLGLVALYAARRGRRTTARLFAAAAVIYFFGAAVLTFVVNVPMNQELLATAVPTDRAAAEAIWADYSSRWQVWNITRTVFSGVALIVAALGLSAVRPARA